MGGDRNCSAACEARSLGAVRSTRIFVSVILSLALLLVLFPLVLAASSSYTFSELKAGEEYAQRVTDPQIPIQEFRFSMNRTIKDASLQLVSFSTLPSDIIDPRREKSAPGGARAVLPEEAVYRYLHFKRSAGFIQNRLASFSFELVVPQSWLEKNGVARDTISVLSYDSGLWTPVEIRYRGEDADVVIYTVLSSPTLHVIVGKQGSVLAPIPDTQETETAQNRDTPITGAAVSDRSVSGATIAWTVLVFIIIVVVIVAFAYQSKKEQQQGAQKIIPTVSEPGEHSSASSVPQRVEDGAAVDSDLQKKPFMLSDEELQQSKETVRRELGL